MVLVSAFFQAVTLSVGFLTGHAMAAPCCRHPGAALHKRMADQYINTWNSGGATELMDTAFSPDAQFYQDRIYNGTSSNTYPMISRQSITGFMQQAHQGWKTFEFETLNWAGGAGNTVAVQWKVNGIMESDTYHYLPTSRKEGDHITYTGIDILQLEECSGLIKRVDSSQDYITLFHELGLKNVNV